jgi:hypothetical protein
MSLEKEKETYNKKLPELEEHKGKFVLIHGDEIVHFFDTYTDAISQGYQRFGLEPFLVKRIESTERVEFVTRLIKPVTTS